MSDLELTLLFSLTAAVLALLAWVAVAILNRRLRDARDQNSELQQQIDLVRQSISGLTAGAVGVDRRMRQLAAREKVLSERQETYEIQQADEQPYGHAIRLVQQGAGAHRLVQELELSESEAELIVRLHGQRDTA
ncbi:MAG: DUF2802 domain-containing protein [Chromatiaceae bacterium]|nr:DUF2802 domain-containing protein [Chromatiaceae bacterium]MCP5436654.1 DUF2802 domain-containing protein [Chromatiaceae bacterium]HPE81657.1 DUF2802 domain-containing protein [Gammaproteobacteria bacterium]